MRKIFGTGQKGGVDFFTKMIRERWDFYRDKKGDEDFFYYKISKKKWILEFSKKAIFEAYKSNLCSIKWLGYVYYDTYIKWFITLFLWLVLEQNL